MVFLWSRGPVRVSLHCSWVMFYFTVPKFVRMVHLKAGDPIEARFVLTQARSQLAVVGWGGTC